MLLTPAQLFETPEAESNRRYYVVLPLALAVLEIDSMYYLGLRIPTAYVEKRKEKTLYIPKARIRTRKGTTAYLGSHMLAREHMEFPNGEYTELGTLGCRITGQATGVAPQYRSELIMGQLPEAPGFRAKD